MNLKCLPEDSGSNRWCLGTVLPEAYYDFFFFVLRSSGLDCSLNTTLSVFEFHPCSCFLSSWDELDDGVGEMGRAKVYEKHSSPAVQGGSVQHEEQWRWYPIRSVGKMVGPRWVGGWLWCGAGPAARSTSWWPVLVRPDGSGMIVADFRQSGMMDLDRHRLNIFVKTSESWSAYSFSTLSLRSLNSFLDFWWVQRAFHFLQMNVKKAF